MEFQIICFGSCSYHRRPQPDLFIFTVSQKSNHILIYTVCRILFDYFSSFMKKVLVQFIKPFQLQLTKVIFFIHSCPYLAKFLPQCANAVKSIGSRHDAIIVISFTGMMQFLVSTFNFLHGEILHYQLNKVNATITINQIKIIIIQ